MNVGRSTTFDELAGRVALARRAMFGRRTELRHRLVRPVISIGNLSVGGSGKTPVVEAVARLLRDAGWRPAILSRGYGRRVAEDGVVVVSDGERLRADVARAGDEPLMLARKLRGVAVVVCPERYLAGTLAERRLGCDIHVLDDGFQHFALERSLDLLVAGDDDLRSPHMIPFGRLREPLEAAGAADALLWTGEGDPGIAASTLRVGAVFTVGRRHTALESAPFGTRLPEQGARIVAVAAIARPDRFFDELRAAGFDVADTIAYRDHHRFSRADVARAEAARCSAGATAVVTTEKDMVRLLPLRPLPFPLAWCGISATIDPPEAFAAWLTGRIGSPARPGAVA